MARERARGGAGSTQARLFVALDLPAEPRAQLAVWRDELVSGRTDLRPVAVEALHVTLVFLGYRPEHEAEAIAASAFGPLTQLRSVLLAPRALVGVPPRRPRLFALDLLDAGGAAAALQAGVSEALERSGHYEPERRRFWPHVTLARVKRDRRADPLVAAPPEGAFEAASVTLYRSRLRPGGGALYEPLACARIGLPS